ncbi:MAG: hypothetical protein AAF125_25405, partial [Chloroflexota bacterium]
DAHGQPLKTPVIVAAERDMTEDIEELTTQQREVLEVMGLEAFEHGCTPSQVSSIVNNVSERNVYKVISRFKAVGIVQQSAARQPYTLTDKGREILGHPVQTEQHAQAAHTDETQKNKTVQSSSLDSMDRLDRIGSMFSDDDLLPPSNDYARTSYAEGL